LGNYNQPSRTSVCLAKILISLPLKFLKTPQLLRLHPLVVLLQLQKELHDRVKRRWGTTCVLVLGVDGVVVPPLVTPP
jgi:hypothetical protein